MFRRFEIANPLTAPEPVDGSQSSAPGHGAHALGSVDSAPPPDPAADTIGGGIPGAGSISVGSSVDVIIETLGDHDWYAVTLTAGTTYTIHTTFDASRTDAYLNIRDSGGAILQSDDDSGEVNNSLIGFTPSVTGTYYIDAGTYQDDTTGSFHLSVAAVVPPGSGDTAGDSIGTAATLAVTGSINGNIDFGGDHDFYRITLTAGQTYIFWTGGTTASDATDTTLTLRDANGNELLTNDDTGQKVFSAIRYTVTTTGDYYLDVGGFQSATGAYNLTAFTTQAPELYTNDQIAFQLTDGYWHGFRHHFNVTTGGTLTFNVQALTAAGQTLARAAVALWSDVTGITFSEVTTGGMIVYDDDEAGAFASASYSGGITSSASINVSETWLTTYGSGLNSYTFQAYVHETGHALGLGHAGHYNSTANYNVDSLYLNDSWATTVMSYFDQDENTYFAALGFTEQFVLTPMVADIVAMADLYGTSTTTRTGNTTYGFNNTSGRAIFDATTFPSVTYTIFDNGGNDTLDYSGFSANQVINLNPETFSSVGTRIGNVSIARGTIIENVIGGSGNDTLIGNTAGNSFLLGFGGNDTVSGTLAQLTGDTVSDMARGDRIHISGAAIGDVLVTRAGATLALGGGVTMTIASGLRLTAHIASDGGVDLLATTARHDASGDGFSDILWRNANGILTAWNGTAGGFVAQSLNLNVSVDWQVTRTGDFDGNGRIDILWRNVNGGLTDWFSTGSGYTAGTFSIVVSTDWQVAGVGDFDGDGRDDILWRNTNGTVTQWLSDATGFNGAGQPSLLVSADWHVAAIGDIDGDGRDDILWRNDDGRVTQWLGVGNGFNGAGQPTLLVGNDWQVAGLGDFNGDGRDDILWRNVDGRITQWLGVGNGFNGAGQPTLSVGTEWHVANIGDYSADARDDILWRHDNGGLTTWLGVGTGFNGAGQPLYNVGNEWMVTV